MSDLHEDAWGAFRAWCVPNAFPRGSILSQELGLRPVGLSLVLPGAVKEPVGSGPPASASASIAGTQHARLPALCGAVYDGL